jgi:hypothetical protein
VASGTITPTIAGTEFGISSSNCTTLGPNLTCTIGVVFHPTTTGVKTGTLSLAASPGGPASAALAGTAVAPALLTITPTSATFGPVAQGTPTGQSFTVTNTGGAVSGALSTALSGATTDFAITAATDACRGKTLAAGATCTLAVVMTPVAPPGSKSATLTVSASPGGSPTSALNGSSFTTAMLALSPTTGAFGSVGVGATKDLVFTLSNSGTQAAAGITKAVTGAGFSVLTGTGTDCGTTLGGTPATCNVRVRFAPVALGAVTGRLTVTATTGSAPSVVTLNGNGYGIAAVPFGGDLRIAALGGMDGAGTAIVGRMQNAVDTFGFYWVINAASFTTIPPPPGSTASGDARAISSNGLVVTGVAPGGIAWSWTPGSAASKSLNFVGGSAFPLGIDKTGSVIVGNVFTDAGVSAGFVWRSALASGFEPLFGLEIVGVSDGGRSVGIGDQGPMTWTSAGNMTTQPGTVLTNASWGPTPTTRPSSGRARSPGNPRCCQQCPPASLSRSASTRLAPPSSGKDRQDRSCGRRPA